jgi:protein NirF
MKRRSVLTALGAAATAPGWLGGCAAPARTGTGTGDLGIVVERARGTVAIVNTSSRTLLAEVPGLGDLSHASVVFARDGASAFVFGRDGALTRVSLLQQRIDARVMQAGNSIGGAISADGTLVAAQNYTPGGVKVFDSRTLELVADIPAFTAQGQRSRVVGLVDLPGRRFAYALFDAEAICIADLSQPGPPQVTRFDGIGRQPYDALVTPDGRHYIAGLFGEDGLALIDLWDREPRARRILAGYGRGEQPLPVFKMPHLRGWAVAGRRAYLPAVGRHEVLVVDTQTWQEVGRIAVAGQPVFVIARAVLHMEFTPRGEAVWISARDDNRVAVLDTQSLQTLAALSVDSPSGIFFTARAARIGF